MCMAISFGQYVNKIWIPNRILLKNIFQFQDSFKDIADMFDVCFHAENKEENRLDLPKKIDETVENKVRFFYPKKRTNIGYKIFRGRHEKNTVKGLITDDIYTVNTWYEAFNMSLHVLRPYVSGFHIFPRMLDAKSYMKPMTIDGCDSYEIHEVEYDDVLHYGLEISGSVTVIANKMRILWKT